MGSIEAYFVRSADAAHDGFLGACQGEGVRVSSFASSRIGANLSLDVARFGSPDVVRNVVLCTGMGGPAGFVASAILTGCVREGLHHDLPRGLGLILVNGVSPDGPAWPTDVSPALARPRDGWDDAMLSKAEDRFVAFERSAGKRPRRDPAGDGAVVPAWNTVVQKALCDEHFANSRELLFVDFRTGPGMAGEVSIQSGLAGDNGFAERAAQWFADSWTGEPGTHYQSAGAPPAGGLPDLAAARSHVLVVEFGTYSVTTVLDAIASDGSATAAPDPLADLRRMSFPVAGEWKRFVWQNASAIVATALTRFGAST